MSGLISALVGLLTGILSGFGIGGGTLLLLWLTMVTGMEQFRAGGINLVYFVFCALPALYGHIKQRLIEKRAVMLCILAGLPACIAASIAASFIDVTLLRRFFGVFLIFVGLRELFSKKKKQENDGE